MSSLSDKIWLTKKAKIQTEKRLLSNAFQSQILLLWYSFTSVAISIYYLKFSSLNDDLSGITWVIYSILLFGISSFINGLSFKERANLVKECYESLGALLNTGEKESINEHQLSKEYFKILNACENHLDIDYYVSLCNTYLCNSDEKTGNNKSPAKYVWFRAFFYLTRKWIILAFLYTLPIILFATVEKIN